MNSIKQTLEAQGVKASIIRRTKTMNNLLELTENIEQWAADRKLHTADPIKQYDKLIEEFGELMKGINKNDMAMIKDSIGDMYVVLVVMCEQTGNPMTLLLEDGGVDTLRPQHNTFMYMHVMDDLARELNKGSYILSEVYELKKQLAKTCGEYYLDFTECVELAYNEIKGRTGTMINGKFVKSEDLQEADQ